MYRCQNSGGPAVKGLREHNPVLTGRFPAESNHQNTVLDGTNATEANALVLVIQYRSVIIIVVKGDGI